MQSFFNAETSTVSESVVDYIGLAEVSSTISEASPDAESSDLPLPETDLSLELGLGPGKKREDAFCGEPPVLLLDPNMHRPKPKVDPSDAHARNSFQFYRSHQDTSFEVPRAESIGCGPIVAQDPLSRNAVKRAYDAVQLNSSRTPPVASGKHESNPSPNKTGVPVPWHKAHEKEGNALGSGLANPAGACKPYDAVGNHDCDDTAAASGAPPYKSRVVGWPPVATFRKQQSIGKPSEMFVKVNMDGITVGRKVDLNAHKSYDSLLEALEDMFQPSTIGQPVIRDTAKSQKQSWLRSGSEFFLIYEDKENDWMLVGDVPWSLFVSAVQRLRIVRRSEVIHNAPLGS